MKPNQYITSDALLAAALLSCGIKYTETKNINPTRIEFVFDDSTELQNVVTGHFMGALTVPSLTYGNNYKYLMGLISSILRSRNDIGGTRTQSTN